MMLYLHSFLFLPTLIFTFPPYHSVLRPLGKFRSSGLRIPEFPSPPLRLLLPSAFCVRTNGMARQQSSYKKKKGIPGAPSCIIDFFFLCAYMRFSLHFTLDFFFIIISSSLFLHRLLFFVFLLLFVWRLLDAMRLSHSWHLKTK